MRHEFVDGDMYALAGGTITHSMLSGAAFSILRTLLLGGRCRPCTSDVRVQLSPTRYLYPDVSVTCDERDRGDQVYTAYPRAIIEVLSPSTEAYDRGDKFELYRECPTIQEYVLVNSRRPRLEVFRRSRDSWNMHAFGPGDEAQLESLGIRFPVDDVYAGVDLGVAGRSRPVDSIGSLSE